jgi:hypothetical protein
MVCILWKDKKSVLFLSTHPIPIGYLCMPMPIVPKKNGTVQEDIMTSPIYLEYIIHMCGVDVMN